MKAVSDLLAIRASVSTEGLPQEDIVDNNLIDQGGQTIRSPNASRFGSARAVLAVSYQICMTFSREFCVNLQVSFLYQNGLAQRMKVRICIRVRPCVVHLEI